VRQGEIASKGKWTGNPTGGVKAPEPILLPDPSRRFADTAARLETLASGHPMEEWLRFMSRLSEAQHAAARDLPLPPATDPIDVKLAIDARMPPLAADGHRRPPEWRDILVHILDEDGLTGATAALSDAAARLKSLDADGVELLANRFLHGEVASEDAAAVLFLAAALQVYFTRMAANLKSPDLRLLTQRGLCPCCGSTPVAGTITASGDNPGTRYLHCSLCSTAWNHVRTVCITCGESRSVSLEGIEGDAGVVRAETCKDCSTYAKMIYLAKDTKADPFADDLASLGLDFLVAEVGWSRHAPNPLLLSASAG
jgi:FdhE protein